VSDINGTGCSNIICIITCDDATITDLKGTGSVAVDSIHLPQGRVQWQDSVNMPTNV
jgi:hypothetical protein